MSFRIYKLYKHGYTSFQRYTQLNDYVNVYLVTDHSDKIPT